MLKVDRNGKNFKKLEQPTLPAAGWKEREDLQQMIRNSPDAFFEEMGERLLLIGEEIRPTDIVDDRIDLLAIDEKGTAVVIELKRGVSKLQLLQAITYAAMVSTWDSERFSEERKVLAGKSSDEIAEEFEQFLSEDIEEINFSQRIILLAEDYNYEVLIAAKWLSENYEIDIRCYRMALSTEGDSEYLNCTCIYPPAEVSEHATRRGRKGKKVVNKAQKWPDWDTALAKVSNASVVKFFKSELEKGQDNYLRKRILHYRHGGRVRLFVKAGGNNAYVWQHRRFEGDEELWTDRIGSHIKLKLTKKDNSALRFFLTSDEDFKTFLDVNKNDLPHVEFLSAGEIPDGEEENGSE